MLTRHTYEYDQRYVGLEFAEDVLAQLSPYDWDKLQDLTIKELTDEDMCYVADMACAIYCQEMQIPVLTYDSDFLQEMIGILLTNVVVYSLKKKGLVSTSLPIRVYQDYDIMATKPIEEIVTK